MTSEQASTPPTASNATSGAGGPSNSDATSQAQSPSTQISFAEELASTSGSPGSDTDDQSEAVAPGAAIDFLPSAADRTAQRPLPPQVLTIEPSRSQPDAETAAASQAPEGKPALHAVTTATLESHSSAPSTNASMAEMIATASATADNFSTTVPPNFAEKFSTDPSPSRTSSSQHVFHTNDSPGIAASGSSPGPAHGGSDPATVSNPVSAADSSAASPDKGTSTPATQNSVAKNAAVRTDADPGNSTASTAVDANGVATAAAPDSIASVVTVTAASATARPDGTEQNSATSASPNSENGRSQSEAQISTTPPAPSESSAIHTNPVQMAQIVTKAAQSEMRVELNTQAFGSVEVRTTVRANDVGVLIGSEKGDLRSLLTNELPGIASNLQQQNLRLNQVNFHQGFASANNLSSGGGGSQSRSYASRNFGVATGTSAEVPAAESAEAGEPYVPRSANGNLSILA